MKLILSRKGFDSSSGGCPSPIFPDGSLYALPIPDKSSSIRYNDIVCPQAPLKDLLSHLTAKRVKGGDRAHLDPDLVVAAYPRLEGWRPVLGQTGAAQGHLAKQGVGVGDVFLFFGLFREVEKLNRRWRFVPGSRPRHVLWGWLQIGTVLKVDELPPGMDWLAYHPHLHGRQDRNNTLYVASEGMCLGGKALNLPGAGVFDRLEDKLRLTAKSAVNTSDWELPAWIYPAPGREPLSYHAKASRWRLEGDACFLSSVYRGQEFVLDASVYPEALGWLRSLFRS